MPYGSEWRACRKLEHIALSSSAVKKYEPLQERLAAMLVCEISRNQTNFYDLVRLYVLLTQDISLGANSCWSARVLE